MMDTKGAVDEIKLLSSRKCLVALMSTCIRSPKSVRGSRCSYQDRTFSLSPLGVRRDGGRNSHNYLPIIKKSILNELSIKMDYLRSLVTILASNQC